MNQRFCFISIHLLFFVSEFGIYDFYKRNSNQKTVYFKGVYFTFTNFFSKWKLHLLLIVTSNNMTGPLARWPISNGDYNKSTVMVRVEYNDL